MANTNHISTPYLITLTIASFMLTLGATYLYSRRSQFLPLPDTKLWNEIEQIAGQRWKVKGGK